MTTHSGSAKYEGFGKDGLGHVSTQSGALADHPYGFKSRFEDGPGTNPEELIAASHAGCFTMALSAKLTEAGHPPEAIDTKAEVELSLDGAPTIAEIRLSTRAKVPGLDAAQFRALADDAKQNCPISKALSAVPISLEAELLS